MSSFSSKARWVNIIIILFVLAGLTTVYSLPAFADSGPGTYCPGISAGNENAGGGDLGTNQVTLDKGKGAPDDKTAYPDKKVKQKDEPSVDKQPSKLEEVSIEPVNVQAEVVLQGRNEFAGADITEEAAGEIVKTAAEGGKKEGALRNAFLQFKDKKFEFSQNPLARIEGRVYVCATSPDFKNLMKEMGLTYSWLSYSGKLFVYLPQGAVRWNVKEDYAIVGSEKVKVIAKARDNYGMDYIPLDTLAQLLDLEILEKEDAIVIKPGIRVRSAKSKDEDTLDLFLTSCSRIDYEVKYQAKPPSVRFTIPRAVYNGSANKFHVEGVEVRINDTLDPDKLYLTLEFPPHWKGKIIPTSYKNQVLVRMKPNIVYAWGMQQEKLKSIQTSRRGGKLHLLFRTSNIVQYYWSFDPEESILYVDMPFTTPAPDVRLDDSPTALVKKCRISLLKPDEVNITRIKLYLEKGASFMIGPPEDQKGYSFALLVGPKDSISNPSPLIGSSGIIIPGGPGSPLVVIDPGHGGSDAGACYAGYQEKDLTLDISKRLAKVLSRRGFRVILTRYNDSDVTYPGSPDKEELQARADVANKNNATLFISIHCNASIKKEMRGSSYHWFKLIDRPAALAMKGSLGEKIGTVDKGVRKDQFYVLSHTRVPAVLVETAFMSNPGDIKLLANAICRGKIAVNLARAIEKYVRASLVADNPIPDAEAEE